MLKLKGWKVDHRAILIGSGWELSDAEGEPPTEEARSCRHNGEPLQLSVASIYRKPTAVRAQAEHAGESAGFIRRVALRPSVGPIDKPDFALVVSEEDEGHPAQRQPRRMVANRCIQLITGPAALPTRRPRHQRR